MQNDFFLQPSFSLAGFDSMREYFGILSMYEPSLQSLVERFNGLNLHAHFESAAPKQAEEKQKNLDYSITPEGIAILPVNGPMMKYVSSLGDGTSTVRMRQQLRAARKNPDVLGALMFMDTPGGTVRGNNDLADEVARFAEAKPIYAFTEDMTASAGVSVASQATMRYANNATALYGAMGTYSVLVDQSGRAEQLGVKVHVIKAGEFKGMGEPGTAVSEEQLKEAQRIVNSMNENYLQLIARGTKLPLEVIRSLADGRVMMAADAVSAGLINGIQTFDQTYEQLVAATSKNRQIPIQRSKPTMQTDKTPATLAELKATFPNSTAEWRESQMEAGNSLPESAIAYAKFVETKAKADADVHAAELKAEKERSQAAAEEAAAKAKTQSGSLGHRPLTTRAGSGGDEGETQSGDPIEDFNQAVAKLAGPNADLARRQRAIRAVATSNPQLYASYMLASNPGRRQERLITEKLESINGRN